MVIYIYIDYTLHLWVLKHLSFSPLFLPISRDIILFLFIFLHFSFQHSRALVSQDLRFVRPLYECDRNFPFGWSAKIYLSTCLETRGSFSNLISPPIRGSIRFSETDRENWHRSGRARERRLTTWKSFRVRWTTPPGASRWWKNWITK